MPDTNKQPESRPASVVTQTGEHPAVVLTPEPTTHVIAGVVVDVVVLAGIMTLIALDKVSPAAGLPWIALMLGVKGAKAFSKRPPGPGSGAVVSLLGIATELVGKK